MATKKLSAGQLKEKDFEEISRAFITKVYRWMTLALVISGFTALYTASSQTLISFIFGSKFVFYGLLVVELALVFILSAALHKMSVGLGIFFFILYSVINGLTISSIFIIFEIRSIFIVFFISAAMFAGMSIYGVKTKQNLMSAGRYLMMALIGLIIASLVNLLLKSSMLEWIISLISVAVFTGLTAYDTQKMFKIARNSDDSEIFQKAAIMGALELYLDFINIFLSLLNLFGKRKS